MNIGAGGTLSPGDAPNPGRINITGNYSQTGTLDEAIAGTPGSGLFDVTSMAGTADLGGTLDISLLNGFAPRTKHSYLILDATGGVSGTFGTVDFINEPTGDTYSLDYSLRDEVLLDINGPVINNGQAPEPAFFLPLIGIGAALVGQKLRKGGQAVITE